MQEKVKNMYEYMLLYLAYDYVVNQLNRNDNANKSLIEGFKEFNVKNDFSFEKRILLPFLVTIGNGKKSELLKTFFPFIITNNGFISEAVTPVNASNFFDFNEKEKLSLKSGIIEKFNDVRIIDSTDYLKKKHDFFINGIQKIFIDENNLNDSFELEYKLNFEYIRISIDNINRKIPNFANEKLSQVIYWSKFNRVYHEYKSKFIDLEGESLSNISIDTKINLNVSILIHDFELQLRRQSESLLQGETIFDIYTKFKEEVSS